MLNKDYFVLSFWCALLFLWTMYYTCILKKSGILVPRIPFLVILGWQLCRNFKPWTPEMHSSVQGQQRIELFDAPGAYKFILTVFILKSKQCISTIMS